MPPFVGRSSLEVCLNSTRLTGDLNLDELFGLAHRESLLGSSLSLREGRRR